MKSRTALFTAAIFGLTLSLSMPVMAETDAPRSGPERGKIMEKIDKDGDGTVSESEFLSQAEEHFDKIDADNDGNLTREEMRAHHQKMREKRKDRVKEWRENRGERRGGGQSGTTEE